MAKTKKISINAMDKVVKDTYIPTTIINWNGLEVVVKHNLSFTEVLEFVDSVTKTCFSSDTGTYMPEVKDFAVKSNILERYANFTLPNNLEHRYEIIYHTNIIETVLGAVNHQQFNEMMVAIDAKIKNIAQANIENINKQMSELYTAFDNLQKSLEKIFDGVNTEDVVSLMKTMTEGSLDESKIIEAYLAHTKKE